MTRVPHQRRRLLHRLPAAVRSSLAAALGRRRPATGPPPNGEAGAQRHAEELLATGESPTRLLAQVVDMLETYIGHVGAQARRSESNRRQGATPSFYAHGVYLHLAVIMTVHLVTLRRIQRARLAGGRRMNWQQWLPSIFLAVIAAGGGIVGTVWVKRLNRSVDRALARKSTSESKKAEAETISLEVATARALIEEIEKMMARQRISYEAQIGELSTRHDRDLRDITERIRTLERREQQLRTALNDHLPWDLETAERIRTVHPDWPDPPPIDLAAPPAGDSTAPRQSAPPRST
ncbi:hypothetical protein FHX75_11319 [Micromonospora palomenae]|uniref:Uncharacterized protein n=1 Tax=Micromonospora palomenae TaxID=1461247 RepID=A0A561WTL2_9ACTN|nr:hypothetical protein [Micromonospora palomenae]TWG27184.1 hypothetical protein FHX75_11319 [Micromonospora palomenae]